MEINITDLSVDDIGTVMLKYKFTGDLIDRFKGKIFFRYIDSLLT
jgi:hypothetical protein